MDRKLLTLIAVTIRNRIKARIRENKVSPKTRKNGGTTLIRSGKLMNSINYKIEGDKIIIGTNIPYAKIHHFGGTIVPKKAKFLAVPITKAAKAMSPRDFSDTFVRNGVIFRKTDKGKAEALYVLKKSVTIPARPYLFLNAADKEYIVRRIREYYQNNLKK